MVQPDTTLEADDLHGVVERVQRYIIATDADGPEAVAGERIDEIEGTHDEDLFPPPGAVLAHLLWFRGRDGVGHGASTLGRSGLGLTPSVGWKGEPY